MKYLIGIPMLYGAEHCREAILSAGNKDADVLIIDNGADADVKQVINEFVVAQKLYDNPKPKITVISYPFNTFVNPAWNDFLYYFLKDNTYDVLCIMNSDVVLPANYIEILNSFYSKYPNDIPLPVEGTAYPNGSGLTVQPVDGGIAGTFICLTRQQARNVAPIPSEIKLWFGDNWLLQIHREIGIKTYLVHELKIQHGNSRTISILPNVSELIEQDKIAWTNIVEPKMRARIEELKGFKQASTL